MGTMHRLVERAGPGEWPASQQAGSLTMTHDERQRRRLRLVTDQHDDVLLDLPRPSALSDGDGLKAEGGAWFRVVSAPEPVLEIRTLDARHLARIAWHLGNRHCMTEIRPDTIRVRYDHVLEIMAENLGGICGQLFVPFEPERGAYDQHDEHHHHHE